MDIKEARVAVRELTDRVLGEGTPVALREEDEFHFTVLFPKTDLHRLNECKGAILIGLMSVGMRMRPEPVGQHGGGAERVSLQEYRVFGRV